MGWEVFGVVVDGAAGDVWGGCDDGFFGGLVLGGGGVVLGGVPDVLGRVVVGRVRRQINRCDALQQPARLVEAGQRFRMVEAGVVQNDRDLAGLGFSLEPVQREDRLPGVPVPLDRVQRDLLAGQGEGAEEGLGRPLPVHVKFGSLPLRGAACCGSRLRARGTPRLWCGPPSPGPAEPRLGFSPRSCAG